MRQNADEWLHWLCFYLEGDPAAGENKAVLFRQQYTLVSVLLASSRGLDYEGPDGVPHITKGRWSICMRERHKYTSNPKLSIVKSVSANRAVTHVRGARIRVSIQNSQQQ